MAQRPLYQKIAEHLRAQITAGDLRPGFLLLSQPELGDKYGASRNTIRDAIKRLTSQGLVETRPGQGTFVSPRMDPFVTVLSGDPRALGGGEGATYLSDVYAAHRTARTSEPRVEVHNRPPVEVSRHLGVAEKTPLVSRHQMRYIDAIPWSLQTSFYPMDFVVKGATRLLMAADIQEGSVRYLAESLGIRQAGYRDWITARRPDANEQTFFGLAHDATVFEIFRTPSTRLAHRYG